MARRAPTGGLAALISLAAAITLGAPGPASAESAPETRIVGGTTTTIEQWPWQAAIALNPATDPRNAFARQFCGGTLVAPTVVITAAHCVYDFGPIPTVCNPVISGFNFAPDEQTAITGRTELTSTAGAETVVEEIYYFVATASGPALEAQSAPGEGNVLYDCTTNEWDVALLELGSPAPAPAAPIQLAGADEVALWAPQQPAFITGWGRTSEGGSASNVLQAGLVEMVSDADCGAPTSYGAAFVAETMVCAGIFPEGGVDTCAGDSGGPLVVPAEIGAAIGFRLVGDTSFGAGCAQPSFPGVYGRLAADPMRSALQGAVRGIAGVEIVGAGARPVAAPETSIARHPKKKVRTRRRRVEARFTFAAGEPARFECRLDSGSFRPCASPFRKRVGRGRHSFAVHATDDAGLGDESPARFRWRVIRRR